MTIEEGLDFIERHLEPPIFPRRISTFRTGGKQIQVNNREEALAKFKECNVLDCGISAYPYPVPGYRGVNRQSPNLFLADLDKKNFKTKKSFEEAVQNTLKNFKDKLHGANPSVLWSGGGNHFLQPLYADVLLETESVFSEFAEPSRKLMQYAEKIVTDNKGDPCHCNTVSFNNCMIRIPGSYNSKYIQFDNMGKVVNIPSESEVKIVQRWDDYRPNIRWLLKDYWIYLIQERNNELLKRTRDEQKRLKFERGYCNRITVEQQTTRIDWIESLYAKSLDDFRKYCTWRIFTPYFMNVRTLSRTDVFNLIMNWLDRCSSECRRLDFNPRQKVNDSLDSVKKYRPVSKDRLKIENEPLYLRLKEEGIFLGGGSLG
ncbi:MAG: hypothetical protein WAM14_15535 [Candidatus Nitrosopolaris sp.]